MRFFIAFLALASPIIAATIPDTDTSSDVPTMANTTGALHDPPEGTADYKLRPLVSYPYMSERWKEFAYSL